MLTNYRLDLGRFLANSQSIFLTLNLENGTPSVAPTENTAANPPLTMQRIFDNPSLKDINEQTENAFRFTEC